MRHYEGINPEVEAELKKVIEELQEKGSGETGLKDNGYIRAANGP